MTIIHLPVNAIDWTGILVQFTMRMATQKGRAYASWATERLSRALQTSGGVVALADGELRGFLLFEVVSNAVEMTFPWTDQPNPALSEELARATLAVVRELPDIRYLRAERQLLPGDADTTGLEAAGFHGHWRRRMILELRDWDEPRHIPPCYRFKSWQIRYLDAAAEVIYRANLGTLDAILYAPFFGGSSTDCRIGLLAILAGRYGPVHPQATICAFHGSQLVGINLLIADGPGLASVVEISVDPAHQGKGLGRALMTQSVQVLRDHRIERVELAVTHENTKALHLYESLGFLPYGDFPVCVWPERSILYS